MINTKNITFQNESDIMLKTKIFIIGSLGLYFGWMLAFPFYGPIYSVAFSDDSLFIMPMVMVFMIAHTMTYIVSGICLRQTSIWFKMMIIGLAATLMSSLLLVFNHPWLGFISMLIMGIASAVFILGWSVVFSFVGEKESHLKIMASTIVLANLVVLVFFIMRPLITINNYLILSMTPLILTAFLIKIASSSHVMWVESVNVMSKVPKHLLLIFFLFIFNIYLNGGFMYTVMLPSLRYKGFFAPYYPYLLYMLVLTILYVFNQRISNILIAYLGIALLGLAFISFALLNESIYGYIMTIGLMEAAFALLDLFLWTSLGLLVSKYGKPYLFFGILLAANTTSIIVGHLISDNISNIENNRYLVVALLSAASIFLAVIVIPWLMRIINASHSPPFKLNAESIYRQRYAQLITHLPQDMHLTQRESEVVMLVLKGLTNKDIANELFISEHTIKTHLKKIHGKFGVSRKKDLIYLASNEKSKP